MDCSRSTPLTTLLLVLNECARQLPSDKLVPFQTFCSSNYNYLSYLINHILSGNHLLASVDCFSTAFLIFGPKPTVFQIQPATMPQTTKEWNFLPIVVPTDRPGCGFVLPSRRKVSRLARFPQLSTFQYLYTYPVPRIISIRQDSSRKSHIHQRQMHNQPIFQYLRTYYEWRPMFGSFSRPFFVPDHPTIVIDNLHKVHSQSTPNTFNFLLHWPTLLFSNEPTHLLLKSNYRKVRR